MSKNDVRTPKVGDTVLIKHCSKSRGAVLGDSRIGTREVHGDDAKLARHSRLDITTVSAVYLSGDVLEVKVKSGDSFAVKRSSAKGAIWETYDPDAKVKNKRK